MPIAESTQKPIRIHRKRSGRTTEGNIEWRRSFRALLRAAKGIQNKTIANKVVRNIKLTYHLVPKQQHETWVDPREGNQASPSGEDYERKDRRYEAALRFINHLATISKEDFVDTFHVIHDRDKRGDGAE